MQLRGRLLPLDPLPGVSRRMRGQEEGPYHLKGVSDVLLNPSPRRPHRLGTNMWRLCGKGPRCPSLRSHTRP